MRNRILGGIGILWGGVIVFRWLFTDSPVSENTAYQSGQSAGIILGIALLVAGFYYFFKKR